MRVVPEVTLSWLYTVLRFPARLGYPAGAVAELVVNAGHIGAQGPFEFLHHNDGKNGIHRLRAVELLDDANRRVEADRPTGTVVLPGHLRQGGQTTAGRMITHRQKKIVGGWSRHENSVDSVCAD